ncbi:hypothetical protein JCM19992_16920 [Thermostilla marina]
MRRNSLSYLPSITHLTVVSSLGFCLFLCTSTTDFSEAIASEITVHVAATNSDAPGEPTVHTLEEALRRARELRKGQATSVPVTIAIHAGTYPIEKPIVLTPEDSGRPNAPLVIRAAGDGPVVISGGKPITGWRLTADGLWQTEIPEVREGRWHFRELFVGGTRRLRARKPNKGFLRVAGFPDGGREVHYHTDCRRFEFAPGDLDPDWYNLNDVEVIVYHFWTDSHLPIESIDSATNIVTFRHKAGKVFTDDFTSNGARYIVENVREELDAPGEWYLDRRSGILTYKPLPGEHPDRTSVIAPIAPRLVELRGNPSTRHYVRNVEFRDIAFAYANFELPIGNSNDKQGSASVPAAIYLRGAEQCTFEHCTVENVGTFAFEIAEGCRDNAFRANRIAHCAAGAFRINGGDDTAHPLLRTGNNEIADNVVEYYGEVYPSAVGILLMHTFGNRVSHNHIHHGWYTGVSVGWEWGYQRSISRDNRIEFNHIHHIGQGLLSDMGAVYTLGVSPGTVIRNNLIHDVDANQYGGWGIYNDEGSTHILIENNIVYNTKFATYNIHYAKEVTVCNNVFALGKLEQISRGRVEPHISVFFENNIVYWREGKLLSKNWSDEPYTFHFHPKNAEGERTVDTTFVFDYNLYFNPTQSLQEVDFAGGNFAQWQARGKDEHSLYADPKFRDPENGDFTLAADSPAFDLGFRPIDTTTIGPRTTPGPRTPSR